MGNLGFNFPRFRPGDLGHFLMLAQMFLSGKNNTVETRGEARGKEDTLPSHPQSSGLLEPWVSPWENLSRCPHYFILRYCP